MSLHHVVPAVLLFAAAVGWAFTPPPDLLSYLRGQTLPSGCVLLGVGVLLLGWHGRPLDTLTRPADRV